MKEGKKIRLHRFFTFFLLFFILFSLIHFMFYNSSVLSGMFIDTYNVSTNITEQEALNIIKENEISSLVLNNDRFVFSTADGSYYLTPVTDNLTIALDLEGLGATDLVLRDTDTFPWTWVILIGGLCLVSISIFAMRIYREIKVIDAAKSVVAMSGVSEIPPLETLKQESSSNEESKESVIVPKNITFEDVQGIDELKPDLYRLVDCLKNPDKYREIGARMPKGVIFYGPPGTGKTLTAKALAGEAGVPFFSICGSDFVEKYVGVGASRVRALYKNARKSAPCIVFIDEIDAIGGERGESNNGEKDQTINALLAELDGFKSTDNVLTICATNRLDILDPALLRAGRFDLKLAIGLPDKEGREKILKVHAKNKKFDETVDIKELAGKTVGFSGAELENLLNESALIAANSDKKVIDKDAIEDAFFKILLEGNKKPRKEKDEDAILTAYHEAGHTVVSKLLTKDSVPTVTIIQSTSGTGGVTFRSPDEKNLPSKKYLRNTIKISYGGRAAEELYLGNADDITTGASADIRSATATIKAYIGSYGMGNKGLLDIKQLTNQYDIVEEATELSNKLYDETLELLREHFDVLKEMAERLLDKETLYEPEIDEIMGIQKEEKCNFTKE